MGEKQSFPFKITDTVSEPRKHRYLTLKGDNKEQMIEILGGKQPFLILNVTSAALEQKINFCRKVVTVARRKTNLFDFLKPSFVTY